MSNVEREQVTGLEGGSEPGSSSRPLAQRLREYTVNLLKDSAALSLRMIIYVGSGMMTGTLLQINGVDSETALKVGLGTMVVNSVAGEWYYMSRLGRVISQFRADRSGGWEEKQKL